MSPDLTRIDSSHLSLTVSALGAEMQSLRDQDGGEWLWQGDPEFWSGRAPVLFPIVGRAPNDCIAVGDHTAHMAQHGFARKSRFSLEHASASMCPYVLTATDDTRALYPFDFSLSLNERLFDEDAMIFPQGAGTELSYGVTGGPCLEFNFENLPNLALWSKPKAPFICVEPWHGMAAQVGSGPQISDRPFSVVLKSNETSCFCYSVCVGNYNPKQKGF
jgi:galactose mutarotase-like enzyme